MVSVRRTLGCVTERGRIFPLPFKRGEDQGEGLIRRPFVSLTKWPWRRGEGDTLDRHHTRLPFGGRPGSALKKIIRTGLQVSIF
jgi:hypothetical protein